MTRGWRCSTPPPQVCPACGPSCAIASSRQKGDARRPTSSWSPAATSTLSACSARRSLIAATWSPSSRRRTSGPSMAFAGSKPTSRGFHGQRGHRCRRLRAALHHAPAEAPVHHPRPPEPHRGDPADRAREALVEVCRRHGVLIVEDVAYRELTFTAERPRSPVVAGSRRRRAGGNDLEDVLPRRPPGMGGRSAGGAGADGDRQAELGPVRRRAGPASLRGVPARRPSRPPTAAVERAVCRRCAGHARLPRRAHAGRGHVDAADGGFFTWLTGPGLAGHRGPRRARPRRRRRVRPGRPFHPMRDGLNTLRLSFSLADEATIDEGVSRLGTLIRSALEKR